MKIKTVLFSILLLIGGTFMTFATDDSKVPYLTLNNGVEMPQFGLGTFALDDNTGEAYNSVLTALNDGYRHIDTAHAYGNERSVGKAIKASGVPREEIWVTSKLWPNEFGEGTTREAFERMLNRLQLDYIDLVFLHQPVGDVYGAWKDLTELQKEGKVRALGISNFDKDEELFDEFLNTVEVKPQVMQLEAHPYAARLYWSEKLKQHNIAQEDWYPLGGRQSQGLLLRDEVINDIAKAHNKSAAQVILRWHIQNGNIVIPGSSNPNHIKENIEIFDFELTPSEMSRINSLNKEERIFNPPFEEQRRNYLNTILID